MSKREYTYVPFNDISWRVDLLGEFVYLLTAPKDTDISQIHDVTFLIKETLGKELSDIVPSYHSIAVFTRLSREELLEKLSNKRLKEAANKPIRETIQIPICYELGMDLEAVANHGNLSPDEVIKLHVSGKYRSLFIGFTPGFIYSDGLNEQLACPRKTNPRKYLDPGSVGIGGSQTGIYSLSSPGGWNIIGRTPIQLFDGTKEQPMLIEVGTPFQFYRITQKEFESWEN